MDAPTVRDQDHDASQTQMIPASTSFAAWRADPAYLAAYDRLEDEFAQVAAAIRAREETGSGS